MQMQSLHTHQVGTLRDFTWKKLMVTRQGEAARPMTPTEPVAHFDKLVAILP